MLHTYCSTIPSFLVFGNEERIGKDDGPQVQRSKRITRGFGFEVVTGTGSSLTLDQCTTLQQLKTLVSDVMKNLITNGVATSL